MASKRARKNAIVEVNPQKSLILGLSKNKLQKRQILELRLGVNKMKKFSNAMKELSIIVAVSVLVFDVTFIIVVLVLAIFFEEYL